MRVSYGCYIETIDNFIGEQGMDYVIWDERLD
jgi:hypothetical protein